MQCPHPQHKQNATITTMTAHPLLVTIHTCLPPTDTFGFCSALVVPMHSPSQQHQHNTNNNNTIPAHQFIVIICTCLPTVICGFGSVLAVPMQCPTRQHQHTSTSMINTTTTTTKTAHMFIVIITATSDPTAIIAADNGTTLPIITPTAAVGCIPTTSKFKATSFAAANTIDSFTTSTNVIFHTWIILHGNADSRYPPVFLIPHVADWIASHSAPSSILDGALTMLGQPSSQQWKTLLIGTLTSSIPRTQPLTHKP
jgi:hypothetical protein